MIRYYGLLSLIILSTCLGRTINPADLAGAVVEAQNPEAVLEAFTVEPEIPSKTHTELRLDSLGLVDIRDVDDRIEVFLVYATPDNFVGELLYDDITRAYLLPEAAAKLSHAQDILESLRPGYRLLIYDAARPMSVQRKMRRIAEATGKHYYVADPSRGGGLHNSGAAVDLPILDENGRPLPMGTAYDHLVPGANIDREQQLVASGTITPQELDNRLLLRTVMREAGFTTVQSEWWHFNHTSRQNAQRIYPLIDF